MGTLVNYDELKKFNFVCGEDSCFDYFLDRIKFDPVKIKERPKLIKEFDQHPKYFKIIWTGIKRHEGKVLIRTHNLEFIDWVLKYEKDLKSSRIDDVLVITLRKNKQRKIPLCRLMGGLEAYEMRDRFQIELR